MKSYFLAVLVLILFFGCEKNNKSKQEYLFTNKTEQNTKENNTTSNFTNEVNKTAEKSNIKINNQKKVVTNSSVLLQNNKEISNKTLKAKTDDIKNKIDNTNNTVTLLNEDIKAGEKVYIKCRSCHGRNADIEVFRKSQNISKWSKDNIIVALQGYRNGTYGGLMKATMTTLVKNMSDEEFVSVAEYINSLSSHARNN